MKRILAITTDKTRLIGALRYSVAVMFAALTLVDAEESLRVLAVLNGPNGRLILL